jgi:hypothetical protein
MSRSYTSSPPCASMACSGTALALYTIMTYVEHGIMANVYKVLVGKSEKHSEDLDVVGRIILKWVLVKQVRRYE